MKSINKYFDYLYTLERVGMKYDLKNITKLLIALGSPHKKFKSIHIAGTNGKGATASFIASILQEQGFKTGLFTSPHILKFNERIRINGKCIDDKYIRGFLDKHISLIKKVKPSFFEVNTAMAFKYFADKGIKIAVVECGLGGRLDSTNILTPDVCVITQIGIDHTRFLGNTLQKIAAEKAGILKHGSSLIISDTNKSLRSYFKNKVKSQDKIFTDEFANIKNIKGRRFSVFLKPVEQKLNLSIPLPGDYQPRNAVTAIIAAAMFNERMNRELYADDAGNGLKNVIKNTGYKGRLFEVKSKNRRYIFDVSHNPSGIAEALKNLKPASKDVVIFGIMADKDYSAAIKELSKYKTNFIFTKPSYQRALEADIMLKLAKRYKNIKTKAAYDNVYAALESAQNTVKPSGRIIIIGSFFLVSDSIKALGFEKYFN
jgi:dihydrofolate synthase / folylpolyglutamate synthase